MGGAKSAMNIHLQEPIVGSDSQDQMLNAFISHKDEYDEFMQLQAERDMLQKQLDKLIGDNGQENQDLALVVDDHILDEPLRTTLHPVAKQTLNEPSEDEH